MDLSALTRLSPRLPATPSAPVTRTAVAVPAAHLASQIGPDANFALPKTSEGSALGNARTLLSAKVLAHQKATHNPVVFAKHVRDLVRYVRHRHLRAFTDAAAMRRFMRRLSRSDKAYELALLDAIKALSAEDEQLSYLGYDDDVLHSFVADHERELTAYLNISKTLSEHTHIATANELVGAYQEMVVLCPSVLSTLSALVRKIGLQELPLWVPFLRSAATADLSSLDVGADKIHLMFVLQELKNFSTLSTLQSLLARLAQNHVGYTPAALLLTTFDFIEQPITTMPKVERAIAMAALARQILFLQDYRNVFNSLPAHAYQSEDEQQNIKIILQKRIDHLIYTEEE